MLKDKLTTLLKIYYYVGGMPEVVDNYRQHKDLSEVRRIQSICSILDSLIPICNPLIYQLRVRE